MYERIVCLTEETTETLYLMEEDWRIVGISGFTVRPPRARKEKPKVSAFTSAKIDRILDLTPRVGRGRFRRSVTVMRAAYFGDLPPPTVKVTVSTTGGSSGTCTASPTTAMTV